MFFLQHYKHNMNEYCNGEGKEECKCTITQLHPNWEKLFDAKRDINGRKMYYCTGCPHTIGAHPMGHTQSQQTTSKLSHRYIVFSLKNCTYGAIVMAI